MNKAITIVIVLVVIVGGFFLFRGRTEAPTAEVTVNTGAENTTGGSEAQDAPAQGAVKEFVVTGSGFKFDPATITVNKGDTVKIVFKNSGGMHDWVIDEFNARTKQIPAGATETISFVADKTGSFEYYCSVGNHRQMGMKGTLIVN